MPNMGAMADSFQSEMSKHNPMAGMAVGYGRAMLQGQVSRFLPSGMAGLGGSFKYYFHVDNAYITKKLKVLLFPFRRHAKEQWARVSDGDGGPGCTFRPPSEDINAPDMYLPLMSFITYAIVVAFVMGTAGEFTPDVLYTLIQSCSVYLLLEVCAIRLGFFLVQMSCSLLDLFAITGYKVRGLLLATD